MKVIHVLRKPTSEGTIASNVLRYGTGAVNVDASRVAHANASDIENHRKMVEAIKSRGGTMDNSWANSSDLSGANDVNTGGRWPANLVLQHLDGCRGEGTRKIKAADPHRFSQTNGGSFASFSDRPPVVTTGSEDGTGTIAAWACEAGCPVGTLDAQSGELPISRGGGNGYACSIFGTNTRQNRGKGVVGFGDTGGASRFFKQFGGKRDIGGP